MTSFARLSASSMRRSSSALAAGSVPVDQSRYNQPEEFGEVAGEESLEVDGKAERSIGSAMA